MSLDYIGRIDPGWVNPAKEDSEAMALLVLVLVTLAFLAAILTAGYEDRPNKNWW